MRYYHNDMAALSAAVFAISHYSLRGYLTSCYLDIETHSYDVTVHYNGKDKPELPELQMPSKFGYDERVTLDGLQIKALTVSYIVDDHEVHDNN